MLFRYSAFGHMGPQSASHDGVETAADPGERFGSESFHRGVTSGSPRTPRHDHAVRHQFRHRPASDGAPCQWTGTRYLPHSQRSPCPERNPRRTLMPFGLPLMPIAAGWEDSAIPMLTIFLIFGGGGIVKYVVES